MTNFHTQLAEYYKEKEKIKAMEPDIIHVDYIDLIKPEMMIYAEKTMKIYCNNCNEEIVIFKRDMNETFYCYKCGNRHVKANPLPEELFVL